MTQVIEVPLPEEVQVDAIDLEMLKSALASFVGTTCRLSKESVGFVRELESEGWRVQVGPTWVAVCRRDRDSEEATGRTPDEAISKIREFTRQYATAGCP